MAAASKKNGEKTSTPPQNQQKNVPSLKLSSFGMVKLFSATKLNLDNILLSEEKLQNPPSLSDGMHIEIERELRFLGCELIQAASILLKLPQVAAATGQILFQRFYYAKSFVRYNFEETAMACVSLASKIEEAPRRIRDVVNVFHHMKQMQRHRDSRKIAPMALDERYVAMKNEVIKAERRVLKELGFCVHVKHPHKLIVSYLKALDLEGEESLIQKAWNYMNDGLRTDLFLRYNTETIACACIFLAARVLDYPLPPAMLINNAKSEEKVVVRKWWELFDAEESNILEACRILLKMYRRKSRPSWNKLEEECRKLKIRLLETAAANKMSVRVENTPNPHATVGGSTTNADKFSPQSRQQSPKASETAKSKSRSEKKERDEKANGASSPYNRKRKNQTSTTQEYQSKRKRHRSSSSESLRSSEFVETSGVDKKKWLPKRYLPPTNSYRNRVIDDRDQQQLKDVASSRDEKRLIRRSLSRSLSPNRRKKERKRSRSSSRVRREQEKREREVRLAMGKKDKSFSSSRHH